MYTSVFLVRKTSAYSLAPQTALFPPRSSELQVSRTTGVPTEPPGDITEDKLLSVFRDVGGRGSRFTSHISKGFIYLFSLVFTITKLDYVTVKILD